MDKRQWRERAAEERAALTVDSDAHCAALRHFLPASVPAGKRVVVYDAMPGEVDLWPLIDAHPQPNRRFAVTRTPARGFVLTVHPLDSPMERHPFGYRQPMVHAPVVPDGDIGAVLVPALAFDRDGVRLGRGKGYYDRFLGRLPTGVLFIGITGGYVVEELPAETFDVAMTHLATASGVFSVPLSGSQMP